MEEQPMSWMLTCGALFSPRFDHCACALNIKNQATLRKEERSRFGSPCKQMHLVDTSLINFDGVPVQSQFFRLFCF